MLVFHSIYPFCYRSIVSDKQVVTFLGNSGENLKIKQYLPKNKQNFKNLKQTPLWKIVTQILLFLKVLPK